MKRFMFALAGALCLSSVSFGAEWLKSFGVVSGSKSGSVKGYVDPSAPAGHIQGLGDGKYSWGGVYAGAIKVKYGTGPDKNNVTYGGAEFLTFCISPFEELGKPDNPWKINTPSIYHGTSNTYTDYDRLARLVHFGWDTAVANVVNSAAFQLAIWSIVQDASPYAGYHFQSSMLSDSAVNTEYLKFLDIANGVSSYGNAAGKMVVFQPNPITASQMLITKVGDNGGGFTPVPEPFTMGLGLAAAGVFIRRRMKKA